jgi:cell division protein FtsB
MHGRKLPEKVKSAREQYELGTSSTAGRFPLDVVTHVNFSFSSGMAATGANHAKQGSRGLFMRLLAGAIGGWRRWATAAVVVLAIGVAYHVVFGQNGLTAYQRKLQDARHFEKQLQTLQHENDMLKSHIDRLKEDPDAIEHQAREELHYTRPGEVIYTLPAPPPAASATAQTSSR